jgi:hypothetical protein
MVTEITADQADEERHKVELIRVNMGVAFDQTRAVVWALPEEESGAS